MVCAHCEANFDGLVCSACGKAPAETLPHCITAATPGVRCGAYLIDLIPAIVASVAVGWIPILGAMIVGFILSLYWLLRDVTGASLGKLALGLRVVKSDGRESGVKERVLRNLPIAFGPSLLMIPLAGYAIGPVVSGICIIAECLVMLSTQKRIGDRLAGSIVIRKQAAYSAPI